MSSTISWLGNKVLDPNASRQESQSVWPPSAETQQGSPIMPSVPPQQGNPVLPSVPPQQGSPVMPYIPPQQGGPITYDTQQGPPPSTERGYIPYYLASNIGKNIRAEFIIGSSQYADKVGKLIEVGINYFVLDDVNSRTHVMCDLYSVKFVTVLQS